MTKAIFEAPMKKNKEYILHAGILAEAALDALLKD